MAKQRDIATNLAREEIKRFLEPAWLTPTDRRTYRIFAMHAAFPLLLTTDLLYNLWLNFTEDEKNRSIHAPREVVSDLLLSGLCRKTGSQTWEFHTEARSLLLSELGRTTGFKENRVRELADFTLLYANERLDPRNPLERAMAEVLRWGALAYVRPQEAAERMALALAESLEKRDSGEQLRVHHLLEKLSGPMSQYDSFRDLRRFATGVAQNVAGRGRAAESAFRNMELAELEIGEVTLAAPDVQQTEPPICFFGYITSPPQNVRSMTVLDFDDEHRRIAPYFRELEERGLIQIVRQFDLRPAEIENILTDESYRDRIAFIHLSGHASTLASDSPPVQKQARSKASSGLAQGFNESGNLVEWRTLVRVFERYQALQLITLDDVLMPEQIVDLRDDLSNRMNKVFRPRMPEGLRNLLVTEHPSSGLDLMPFLEGFYRLYTRNESINTAFNETSEVYLGEWQQLRNPPTMAWLTDGWTKLSDHPGLAPELFDFVDESKLSEEDAALLQHIGFIFRDDEFVGYGLCLEDDPINLFVSSYYYLEGGEDIRFFVDGHWEEWYLGGDLQRDENRNFAWVGMLLQGAMNSTSVREGGLPVAAVSDMPGEEWDLTFIQISRDADGNPGLQRIPVHAVIDRWDLRYRSEDIDSLAGAPILLSNGKVAGFHFGAMSDDRANKVGVWWPGIWEQIQAGEAADAILDEEENLQEQIRELEKRREEKSEDLDTLNELARAYRISEEHKPDEAIALLEQALKIDGQNTFSLNELAMNLRAKGQTEDAINYFEEVTKLDPKNTFALNALGETYLQQEVWSRAETYFQQSLEIDPKNTKALRGLATVSRQQGRLSNALILLQQLKDLLPDDPLIQSELEEVRAEQQARDESVENIREHIQRGDLELAISILLKETEGTIYQEEAETIQSTYKSVQKQYADKKMSDAQYPLSISEIAPQVMDLLDKMEGGQTDPASKGYTIEKIREQIQRGDLELALKMLREITLGTGFESRVSQLNREYSEHQLDITNEKYSGEFEDEYIQLGISNISEKLRSLISEIEQTQNENTKSGGQITDIIERYEEELAGLEDKTSNRALIIYEALVLHYYEILQDQPESDEWKRKYGRNWENIGDYHSEQGDWTAAQNAYERQLGFYGEQAESFQDQDWLLMARAIGHEKLGDVYRQQSDSGDLAQYETALRFFKELEDRNPGYRGLNKALGILYRKLSEAVADDPKLLDQQVAYRRSSQAYFFKANLDEPLSRSVVERTIRNESIDEGITALRLLATDVGANEIVTNVLNELDREWDDLQIRRLPSDPKANTLRIEQDIEAFNVRRLRLRLLELLAELPAASEGTIIPDQGLFRNRRELLYEVLTYAEQLINNQDIYDPALVLLEDFQSYFTPARQEALRELRSLRNRRGNEYRLPRQSEVNRLHNGLSGIISGELDLIEANNAQSSGGTDERQKVLNKLFTSLQENDLKAVFKLSEKLIPFLEAEEDEGFLTEWNLYLAQYKSEDKRRDQGLISPNEYAQRTSRLRINMLELLTQMRNQWYPIA